MNQSVETKNVWSSSKKPGKFKRLAKIGSGGYGTIYLAIDLATKQRVCVKACTRTDQRKKPLALEAAILKFFNGQDKLAENELIHVPRYISLFRTKHTSYLVMENLGKNTLELAHSTDSKRINEHDLHMLGDLLISYLHRLHEHTILHRDLKPHNVVFCCKDKVPYLIDFGLSVKYRHKGKHIEYKADRRVGTCKYMSPHAHKKKTQSRRDDMISLGYVLAGLYLGGLPWTKLCRKLHSPDLCKKKNLRHEQVREKKLQDHDKLLFMLPSCLKNYFDLVWELKFEQMPDYKELRKCFLLQMKANHEKFDYQWSWLSASSTSHSRS